MCIIDTINIHFLDACNYICKHCFVEKENKSLSYDQITKIVDKIDSFYKQERIINGRINLAGGEPLLSKDIDRIIDYIYDKGLRVSLITNGYYLTKQFIDRHAHQLYCIGISIDSLDENTNRIIGRCQRDGKTLDIDRLVEICKYIRESGISLKINTCVSKLNVNEDFNEFLSKVKPNRYKVLQMTCDDCDIANVINRISNKEMSSFVSRHSKYATVKETSDDIKESYLIIDSIGNMSCDNKHQSSYSVLNTEISDILLMLNINENKFERRYDYNYQQKVINE